MAAVSGSASRSGPVSAMVEVRSAAPSGWTGSPGSGDSAKAVPQCEQKRLPAWLAFPHLVQNGMSRASRRIRRTAGAAVQLVATYGSGHDEGNRNAPKGGGDGLLPSPS